MIESEYKTAIGGLLANINKALLDRIESLEKDVLQNQSRDISVIYDIYEWIKLLDNRITNIENNSGKEKGQDPGNEQTA